MVTPENQSYFLGRIFMDLHLNFEDHWGRHIVGHVFLRAHYIVSESDKK